MKTARFLPAELENDRFEDGISSGFEKSMVQILKNNETEKFYGFKNEAHKT